MIVRLAPDLLATELDLLKKAIEVLWAAAPADDYDMFIRAFEQTYPGKLNTVLFPSRVKESLDKVLNKKHYRYFFTDGCTRVYDTEPWPSLAYAYQTVRYLYKDGCMDEEVFGREYTYNSRYCSVHDGKVSTPRGVRVFHACDRLP